MNKSHIEENRWELVLKKKNENFIGKRKKGKYL